MQRKRWQKLKLIDCGQLISLFSLYSHWFHDFYIFCSSCSKITESIESIRNISTGWSKVFSFIWDELLFYT